MSKLFLPRKRIISRRHAVIVRNDEMAIFESAGNCKNPFLDVTKGATNRATGKEFTFKAFTFDSNTDNDTIQIVSRLCDFY